MDGILLLDKRAGCTSHDVVARVRRVLGQREVGHAGTLDPMATGLLVVLAGDATRLSSYLTADSKRYLATVRFGASTDTLDAEGTVTGRSGRPAPGAEDIARALEGMVGPLRQVPPAVSAIKTAGVASHERVRRGEHVELAARDVVLEAAAVLAVREGECDLDVQCSKGFYVRSLARDLAARLGDLAHLAALRRVRSGVFRVDEALPGDALDRAAASRDPGDVERVRTALWPLGAARRAMRTIEVDEVTAIALGHGKRVPSTEPDGVALVLRPEVERPVCVGELRDGVLSVLRGFPQAS